MCYYKSISYSLCGHSGLCQKVINCQTQIAFENGSVVNKCSQQHQHPFHIIKINQRCKNCAVTEDDYFAVVEMLLEMKWLLDKTNSDLERCEKEKLRLERKLKARDRAEKQPPCAPWTFE